MIVSLDDDAGLRRAVEISLFTWRRAEADDPVDDAERYGYWGDSYPNEPGDRLGSRLWLLRRRRLDAATARDAEHYVREALQWMLDDAVIARLDVQLTTTREALRCRLVLHLGRRALEITFDNLWQVIHAV